MAKPRTRIHFLGTALLATVLCAPTRARAQETPAAPLPEARAVIARFAEVTRLAQGLEKSRSRHERGKIQLGGFEGKVESWIEKPGRKRDLMELTGFGTIQSGCDGKVAWMSGQMTGSYLLQGTEFLQKRVESTYDAALKPASLYQSLRTVGRATFEGKECYELELVLQPLEGMDVEGTREARTAREYYEIQSGLHLGTKGSFEGELGSGVFTAVLSDYREFGGQLLPTRQALRQGGVDIVLTIDSVEFDTVTEEDFALPVEIQKMIEAAAAQEPAGAQPAPRPQ